MAETKQPSGFLTPEGRTAIFYSTMFMSAGVVAAYLAIWLSDQGISPSDIGFITSAPIFILMVLNLFVGRIADRANDWRSVIILGSLVSAVVPFALFFVSGFWPILIVWVLAFVPFATVSPVADAAAVRMTRRNGTDFAAIRAWGTAGYMVTLALTGYLAGQFGSWVFLPFLTFVCVLRGVTSVILPRFRAPKGQEVKPVALAATKLKDVMKPWLLLPVFAFALIMSTMMVINSFASLVWKNDGISEAAIGQLLALGALSEVVVMFLFTRIAKRFTARHLIFIAAVVSTIRWGLMALSPPIWILALLQMTHGITFGFAYLGVLNFIANWTSEDMAGEVQSLSFTLQQAVTVLMVSGYGFLMEQYGAGAFFATSGVCLVSALLTLASLRLRSAHSEATDSQA